ncbi:DUF305 domain-containing protein [Labedella endophytica]|uniref:DUF305 domain-containing protein n=1 Tax=Labedella endophytica TaxID=1523160 RepID=A0A3S0X7Y2_9MICO|nr:DUF305 domain-containing protein [Labedella endophytica]RUR01464.1 DUF305 domain-containing protein [Labedella endophytica]
MTDTRPTAAGDGTEVDDRSGDGRAPARRRSPVAVAVIALLVVLAVAAVSFSVGRLSTLGEATPTDTSAEAGFSRDMQTHHNQGVELAFIIRDRSDSEDVRTLAYDIATTQATQSGMMYGWLQEWGLSQAGSEPTMTWMTRPALDGAVGHDHSAESVAHEPGAPMPGLATDAQITELESLDGAEAEVYFLQLMIAHHKGAVDMAVAVLDRSSNSTVTTFANGVVSSQESEIDLMESMLEKRGATDELPPS